MAPKDGTAEVLRAVAAKFGFVAQRSKLWYLKNINLFLGMTEEQMRMVEQRTAMREVRRREVLYFPGDVGDRIYLLKRGVVKISSIREDGREVLLALLRKGEVFGEEAVLDEGPRDHIAEAYEDALICIITRQDAQGVLLPLRLSQQDLANLIGVTRESVNLALSDFRRRGLVVLEGRSLRLPRPEALRELE
jgi:CRP/FNR family transcriptional regulator